MTRAARPVQYVMVKAPVCRFTTFQIKPTNSEMDGLKETQTAPIYSPGSLLFLQNQAYAIRII